MHSKVELEKKKWKRIANLFKQNGLGFVKKLILLKDKSEFQFDALNKRYNMRSYFLIVGVIVVFWTEVISDIKLIVLCYLGYTYTHPPSMPC